MQLALGSIVVLLLVSMASAQAPQLIDFQGKLSFAANGSSVNGSTSITFRIFNASTGGSMLWSETQTVAVQNGSFNVLLGGITSLANLSFGQSLFLELVVGSDTLLPRLNFTYAPLAFGLGARAPRVIWTGDPTGLCPPVRAAFTDLFVQYFTLDRAASVYIRGDMIRSATGRVDLYLLINGTIRDRAIASTSVVEWQDANVAWAGTLAAGNHNVSLQSNVANVWGCGPEWGEIITVLFYDRQ